MLDSFTARLVKERRVEPTRLAMVLDKQRRQTTVCLFDPLHVTCQDSSE